MIREIRLKAMSSSTRVKPDRDRPPGPGPGFERRRYPRVRGSVVDTHGRPLAGVEIVPLVPALRIGGRDDLLAWSEDFRRETV